MSNFKGWTAASVARLNVVDMPKVEVVKKKQPKSYVDYPERMFEVLKSVGIESIREYKFLTDRRFRLDLALPEYQIAIEYEGGIHTGGRHVRGKGFANDAKKYNLATMAGWVLLRYTIDDMKLGWEEEFVGRIKTLISKNTERKAKL
jgi:very-short-patch-repair endonuclease